MILQHCIALILLASQILDSKRRFEILDSTFVIQIGFGISYDHAYCRLPNIASTRLEIFNQDVICNTCTVYLNFYTPSVI